LTEIAINDKFKNEFGVKSYSREIIFKPVDPFDVADVIKNGNNALFQLFRKEYIQKFNGVCDTIGCSRIDIFFYKLNGTRIVKHGKKHVNVLDVILNFPSQSFLDLNGKTFVFNFLDRAEIPANI
jgi:hypothetical protein